MSSFPQLIEARRSQLLAEIDSVPIAALIWGPSPVGASMVAEARKHLKDTLRRNGHLADYSEDLIDPTSSRGLFAQQVAQAGAYDVVFSLPDSPGSIAEIHDFARIPGLSHKIIAFLDQDHMTGYSHQTLVSLESPDSCRVEVYDRTLLPTCIIHKALEIIGRLQEIFYVCGRRR